MAKKNKTVKTSAKPKRPKARSVGSRFRGGAKGMTKNIRWGEAILMALAGYLTGPALQKSGVANLVASELASRSSAAGDFFYHQGSGIPGENMAKLIGTVIGGKGVYDVAKGKSKMGLNVELPYGIGAILDPKSEYGSSGSFKRW